MEAFKLELVGSAQLCSAEHGTDEIGCVKKETVVAAWPIHSCPALVLKMTVLTHH